VKAMAAVRAMLQSVRRGDIGDHPFGISLAFLFG
jgi:hypothetical protein